MRRALTTLVAALALAVLPAAAARADDGSGTDTPLNEAQLCYIQKDFKFEDAVLTDRMYHHDLKVGFGVLDGGVVTDPSTEPVVVDGHAWLSEAIWLRQSRDEAVSDRTVGMAYANEYRHESPNFDLGTNYIYVPVSNDGSVATGPASLDVYWSVASTNLQWPTHWYRYSNEEGIIHGNRIATVAIPSIPAGGMYVAEIPWQTPDPADFGGKTPAVSFLARFVSRTDRMKFAETGNTEANAINNNNIVWRNEVIVTAEDMQPGNIEGAKTFTVSGGQTADGTTGLTFSVPQEEADASPALENSRVIVDLGQDLYDRWADGGFQGDEVEQGEGTEIVLNGPSASIGGMALAPDETFPVSIRFEYEGEELDYPQYYHYDVVQEGGVGGVTFQLQFPAAEYQDLEKIAMPGAGNSAELAGVSLDARPNPTSSSTAIGYRLPETMHASLSIYGINGQLVRVLVPGREMAAGIHTIQWDGTDAAGVPVSNGVYIYRLETPAGVVNRQLMIVR